MGIGRAVGGGFARARDAIARALIRLGVTPNTLSVTGMVLTGLVAVCYALGASARPGWSLDPAAEANAWLLLAGAGLVLASACDMLDGAVARLGGQKTRFGAFLDSTLDRFSDFAVYAGIAVHYAWQTPANVTMVLACMWAFFAAFMISYTRARAEDLIDACKVGYWQRGERSAAILIGTFAHHIPAMVAQQALLPAFSALRRINYTRRVLIGRPVADHPRQEAWWLRIQPWRWPRMSAPYDVITILNIAWLVGVDVPPVDLLRRAAGMG